MGLPTKTCLSISSSPGQLTRLLRSTKQFKKRNSNQKPGIKRPDGYRTTIVKNDFDSINSSSSAHSVSFTSAGVNKHKLLDCQVVLHDVLSTSSTENFQMLNFNLDKTHSVNSRQTLDSHYLNNLYQKDPIAWPRMSVNNGWEQLDSAVSNLLVGAASVFEFVELLEKSIYDQGSLLSGFLPRKEKSLSGLNRRAQYSIKLVKEKNELLAIINNTSDQCTKDSLQTLLEYVRKRLRILRRSESSMKRRWKIKKANQQFLKNQYQAGKAELDSKCEIQLQCDQSLLDTFKSKILSDPSRNIPLPPLDGLPPTLTLLKDFDSTSVRYQNLLPILNSRRNASSPGINMIS